jgi:hypothetical protein
MERGRIGCDGEQQRAGHQNAQRVDDKAKCECRRRMFMKDPSIGTEGLSVVIAGRLSILAVVTTAR